MSETRTQKEAVVEEIKSKIQAAKSVVLVDYKGLTVAQDTELRTNFRKAGVEYKVTKTALQKSLSTNSDTPALTQRSKDLPLSHLQ